MAAFASMYVWFQDCSMRVVEVDGIYTKAAEAEMLYLTAGQRYSVLLTVDSNGLANIPFVASMDEVCLRVLMLYSSSQVKRNFLMKSQMI